MDIEEDSLHFSEVWMSKHRSPRGIICPNQKNYRIEKTISILQKGNRLLDIGCSDGTFGSRLVEDFHEVYGVDIVEEAVIIAKTKGVKSSVINVNHGVLPYEDGYFDVVTMLASLQYVKNPNLIMKECYRVLQNGGSIILCVPNMRTYWRLYKLLVLGEFPRTSMDHVGYDGGTIRYFCCKNVKDLLLDNGFTPQQTYGIVCIPKFVESFTDLGPIGYIKREFFSAEFIVSAIKLG